MADITIIIPTYTYSSGFAKLLKTLTHSDYPIIVIDNKPTKEKAVLCNKPSITYLPQKRNIGFSPAINLGAKTAKTEWIIILNDDLKIRNTKFLTALLETAKKRQWSAVSPVLENEYGEVENLGYRILPIGRAELNFDQKDIIDQRTIDGLTAACLLVNRKDYLALGGLDESFFAYLEDVDFFLRLKHAGYSFGVDTDQTVCHEAHKTTGTMGNFKHRHDFVNWFRVIAKNWKLQTFLHYLPLIFIERLRNLSGLIKATIRL